MLDQQILFDSAEFLSIATEMVTFPMAVLAQFFRLEESFLLETNLCLLGGTNASTDVDFHLTPCWAPYMNPWL